MKFPPFESAEQRVKFMRGGQECDCVCRPKFAPRNAILLRPRDPGFSKPIYGAMNELWKRGVFEREGVGSCQQFIRSSDVRKILKPIEDKLSISCIDNFDGSGLKPGDVLLTRHGRDTLGKPYRITGER